MYRYCIRSLAFYKALEMGYMQIIQGSHKRTGQTQTTIQGLRDTTRVRGNQHATKHEKLHGTACKALLRAQINPDPYFQVILYYFCFVFSTKTILINQNPPIPSPYGSSQAFARRSCRLQGVESRGFGLIPLHPYS